MLLTLLSAAFAADVVAVAYFDAHTVRGDLEPLGRGVSDMLTTDLGASPSLRLVERARIAEVLGELQLQGTAFVDPATAQKVGKGVGASVVVVGSITVAIEGMRIDARLVDVGTGEVRATAQATGKEDQFFALENEVARKLLAALGASAPIDESALPLEQILAGSRAIDEADAAVVRRLGGLGQYKLTRLHRGSLTVTSGSGSNGNVDIRSDVTWVVYEGEATALTAQQFADRIGDKAVVDKITTAQSTGKTAAWTLWGVGAVGLLGGLGVMLADIGDAGGRPRDQTDLMPLGIGLLAVGTVCLPASAFPAANVRKTGWVGTYYSPQEADARIGEYNKALGVRLGVGEADRLSLEVR